MITAVVQESRKKGVPEKVEGRGKGESSSSRKELLGGASAGPALERSISALFAEPPVKKTRSRAD